MTTFKKGDRVKVEVEGTVTCEMGDDHVSVLFEGARFGNSMDPKIVTKIAPAKLDWALGTVLRHRDSKSMYIRVQGGWKGFYGSGGSSGFYGENDWATSPLYDHDVVAAAYDVLNDPGGVWG